VRDDGFRRRGGVIDLGQRQILKGRGGIVAESQSKVTSGALRDRGRIWVHQQLVRVETMSLAWSIRAGNAKPVELADANSLQPYVPDVPRLVPSGVEDDAPSRVDILRVVKEFKANTYGVTAKECEIDAVAPCMCAEGKGYARADGLDLAQAQ
jgi:hypothetical protein